MEWSVVVVGVPGLGRKAALLRQENATSNNSENAIIQSFVLFFCCFCFLFVCGFVLVDRMTSQQFDKRTAWLTGNCANSSLWWRRCGVGVVAEACSQSLHGVVAEVVQWRCGENHATTHKLCAEKKKDRAPNATNRVRLNVGHDNIKTVLHFLL